MSAPRHARQRADTAWKVSKLVSPRLDVAPRTARRWPSREGKRSCVMTFWGGERGWQDGAAGKSNQEKGLDVVQLMASCGRLIACTALCRGGLQRRSYRPTALMSGPLSDSVMRPDQLLRELSGADP